MAGTYRQWSCLQLHQVCQSASSSLFSLFGISASHTQVVDLPLPRVAEMTRYHNPTRPAHLKGGALVRRRRSYSPNEFRSVQAVGLEQKSIHRAKSAPHRTHFGTRENSREKSPSPYCKGVQRVPPSRRDSRSSSRDRSRSKSPSMHTTPIWIRRMRCMPMEHSKFVWDIVS